MTTPRYADEQITLYEGDCLDVLRELGDASIDAVITDPPYGLGFMGHEWDQPGAYGALRGNGAPARTKREGHYDHLKSTLREGAMAAGRYDLSQRANARFGAWCAAWSAECMRVLKPGGHLLAFGGSRTWHRLAAAVEDAGFEVRDSIAWLYGSGFPKSLNVTEAMRMHVAGEQLAEAETLIRPGVYEVTAYLREARDRADWSNRQIDELFGTNGMAGHWTSQASQPAVPSVRQWAALKEALGFGDELDELVEQLASTERPEDWGASPAEDRAFLDTLRKNAEYEHANGWGTALKPAFEPIVVGRRPLRGSVAANVVQWGTGALNIDACRIGTEVITAHGGGVNEDRVYGGGQGIPAMAAGSNPHVGRWPTNVVLDESQAAELDRQSGVSASRRSTITSKPGGVYGNGAGLPAHTGEYGFDDEGGASRFFPTFRYEAKAPTFERPRGEDGAGHPTVKPLDLMRWLIRLVTPPGGVVLDPFLGSGTTAEAAVVEGFRCIGIERDSGYLELAIRRLSKPIEVVLDFGEAS